MYCPNCSKEIPDGSVYCMFCHTPIDFNDDIDLNLDVLEDNELLDVYIEKKEEADKKREIKKNKELKNKAEKKKTRNIIIGTLLCLIIIMTIALVAYSNSSSAKLKNAQKAYNQKNYDKSIELYEQCISKNPNKNTLVKAYIGIGKCAVFNTDYFDRGNECLLILMKATNISDLEKEEAFRVLIDLYSKNKLQDEMLDIKNKYANTDRLVAIYNDKAIELPEFSIDSGEYDDEITIYLSSISGCKIYYTINGDDPSKGNGMLYEKEIRLDDGDYLIKASCYKDGQFGPILENNYKVNKSVPDYPIISPINGTFYEETRVTISSSTPNSKIFYTWDGSTPSANSDMYVEPLLIPEGNNILSVVVISNNGKSSDVIRCNYTYIPQ